MSRNLSWSSKRTIKSIITRINAKYDSKIACAILKIFRFLEAPKIQYIDYNPNTTPYFNFPTPEVCTIFQHACQRGAIENCCTLGSCTEMHFPLQTTPLWGHMYALDYLSIYYAHKVFCPTKPTVAAYIGAVVSIRHRSMLIGNKPSVRAAKLAEHIQKSGIRWPGLC